MLNQIHFVHQLNDFISYANDCFIDYFDFQMIGYQERKYYDINQKCSDALCVMALHNVLPFVAFSNISAFMRSFCGTCFSIYLIKLINQLLFFYVSQSIMVLHNILDFVVLSNIYFFMTRFCLWGTISSIYLIKIVKQVLCVIVSYGSPQRPAFCCSL